MHSVTEVGVNPTDHLNSVAVLASDESQLVAMVSQLGQASLPTPSVVNACKVVEEAHEGV